MKRNELPVYLRESSFSKALSEDDSSYLLIPEDCCKLDADVSSPEELRHLLSTVRFWGLKEIPASCIVFVMENYDDSVSEVLKVFAKEFYLYGLMKARAELILANRLKGCEIELGVIFSALEVLQYYHNLEMAITVDAQLVAVQRNSSLSCFKFVYEAVGEFADSLCDYAAEYGCLEILQFAHEHGAPWCAQTLEAAAYHSKFDCMKYALHQGCPGTGRAMRAAAVEGDTFLLKYLVEFDNGATSMPRLLLLSALGTAECFQYVHELGRYTMNQEILIKAAEYGRVDCMKYALAHGCEWSEEVVEAALHYGTAECFTYAHESGCPMPARVVELAARWGRIDHLKYLFSLSPDRPVEVSLAAVTNQMPKALRFVHIQGCPVNIQVMRAAASQGFYDHLRYLQKGALLDWNASVAAAAAAAGRLDNLQYLHTEGCPWDSNTCWEAAFHDHLACLQYAYEHGCDSSGLMDLVNLGLLSPAIKQYVEHLEHTADTTG